MRFIVVSTLMVCGLGCSAPKLAAGEPAVSSAPQKGTRVEVELRPGATLELVRAPFSEEDHAITRCGERGEHVCLIDGKPFFGTAVIGQLPASKVLSLTLVLDGQRVPLNRTGMFNPWSPVEDRALYVWLEESPELDQWTLRGEFSDGGGAYMVEWVGSGTHSLRTMITCAECLEMSRDSFQSNPDSH